MMNSKSMRSGVGLADIPSSPYKLSEKRIDHIPRYSSKNIFPLAKFWFAPD
jgi:hypothetical protein